MGNIGKINHIRWQKMPKRRFCSHVAAYGYH